MGFRDCLPQTNHTQQFRDDLSVDKALPVNFNGSDKNLGLLDEHTMEVVKLPEVQHLLENTQMLTKHDEGTDRRSAALPL